MLAIIGRVVAIIGPGMGDIAPSWPGSGLFNWSQLRPGGGPTVVTCQAKVPGSPYLRAVE